MSPTVNFNIFAGEDIHYVTLYTILMGFNLYGLAIVFEDSDR